MMFWYVIFIYLFFFFCFESRDTVVSIKAVHICLDTTLTKMYRLHRKMTINGHFLYTIHLCLDTTFLGSIFKPSSI